VTSAVFPDKFIGGNTSSGSGVQQLNSRRD
jgi:hypothetical protein